MSGKNNEIPFTELRTLVQGVFDSADIEDYFIKDVTHPWKARKPDYTKIRGAIENQLKRSLLRQHSQIEDLVDEVMFCAEHTAASGSVKMDNNSSRELSSRQRSLNRKAKSLEVLDCISVSSDDDDNTGVGDENDDGDRNGDGDNVAKLPEATGVAQNTSSKESEVFVMPPSATEASIPGSGAGAVTQPGPSSSDNESVEVIPGKRGRGRPKKTPATDDDKDTTKRSGNYKTPEKGSNINQYNPAENHLFWQFLESTDGVINETFIANSKHPCLEDLRNGTLGTPRDDKSIWYKYQHRKDQAWFKKATAAKEKESLKLQKEIQSAKEENQTLRFDKITMKDKIRSLEKQLSKAQSKSDSPVQSTSSKGKSKSTQKIESSSSDSDNSSSDDDSDDESKKVEDPVVDPVVESEADANILELLKDGDGQKDSPDGPSTVSKESAPDSISVNVSNPNESLSTNDAIRRCFGSNLSSLSEESSVESESKPIKVTLTKKSSKMPKNKTDTSTDSEPSTESAKRSKSRVTAKDIKNLPPFLPADVEPTCSKYLQSSSSSANDRAGSEPTSKTVLKSLPSRADTLPKNKKASSKYLPSYSYQNQSLVDKFNKKSGDTGVRVGNNCIVSVENLQRQKIQKFTIPLNSDTPQPSNNNIIDLKGHPKMAEFDFASKVINSLF